MSQIEKMNDKFCHVKGVRFFSSEEIYPQFSESLPLLVVENESARLVLALNGAHIISFVPVGGQDMLWLSPHSRMTEGLPIRGGIPLCLPWFGPHPEGYPQHGFARITNWQVESISVMGNGATKVVLGLSDTPSSRGMWPHAFQFHLEIVVSHKLELSMAATNLSANKARFEFAFHTYFNVGRVEETIVDGLDGCVFIDREDGQTRKQQSGSVRINGAIQNLYIDVPKIQTIISPVAKYKIEADSYCCMVWNAGGNDKNIPDIGAGNHKSYLCVERVDALDWAVNISPGDSYRTSMILSQE